MKAIPDSLNGGSGLPSTPTRVACVTILLALTAFAQETSAPPLPPTPASGPVASPIAADERFYPHYTVTPIGDGAKVLMTLDNGGQTLNIVVEPIAPKDGGAVVQWVLYNNGGGTLYTKKQIALPGVDGGAGTPVEGISVTRLSSVPNSPTTPVPARPTAAAHQSSSTYTTPPRKADGFKMPLRFEKVGFGLGQPRMWLLWDGKTEVWVQPVETKFKESLWMVPAVGGDISHIKFLANGVVQGSPAPRYFYLKKNRDDSITVYGDDDLGKLKAIEKEKAK